MAEHPIPKGVSLDTAQDIVAGWATVGAADEPRYTSDVAEETGISDAVGRQTRFLEAIGVLEDEGQRHVLTEEGEALSRALGSGEMDEAREYARDLLADWEVTDELYGLLRGNAIERDRLARHLAATTDHDYTSSRVSSGVGTLLDLYEWTGLLERDDDDRCRIPEAAADTEAEIAALRRELDAMREELSAEIAATGAETQATTKRTRRALERAIAAANEDVEASVEETARGLVEAIIAAESGIEQALDGRSSDHREEQGESAVEVDAQSAEPDSGDTATDIEAEDGSGLEIVTSETGTVTVDPNIDTVTVDDGNGSTFELSLVPGRAREPVSDGGSAIDLATEKEENITLDFSTESDIEARAGEAPSVPVETDGNPVEISPDGGPTVELSPVETVDESDTEDETETKGEAEEAADKTSEGTDGRTGEGAGEGDAGTSNDGGGVPASTAGGRPSTSRAGEDAIAISLDLALDADTDDVEGLVRGLRRALVDEMFNEEGG